MTKLWFCDKLPVPVLVALKNISLLCGALSLGTNGLATCGWVGMFGFLPLFGALIPVLIWFQYFPFAVVNPYMQQQAREFVKPGGNTELSSIASFTFAKNYPTVDVPRDSRKSVSGEL